MSVVPGPLPPGRGLRYKPICFTREDAIRMNKILILGGAGIGALIGFFAGLLLGIDPSTKLAGAALGAIAGAFVAGMWGFHCIRKGRCSCPPEVLGYCIELVFYRVPITGWPIPTPPFVLPGPSSCGLITPKCL